MSTADSDPRHVLVTGGCGFLGHHIVAALLRRYPDAQISVVDISTQRNRNSSQQVAYYDLDFTNEEATRKLFARLKPLHGVIHTASPLFGAGDALHKKVNVDGTKILLDAAKEAGVSAFVYTSSASVVFDWNHNLINVDERWPVVAAEAQEEYYTTTKMQAEALVLAANRSNNKDKRPFLTTSLRPAGIFGEKDGQVLFGLLKAYRGGKSKFQIGDNTNLFDFTYVGNAAEAHVSALTALMQTLALAPTLPLDSEQVDGESFFITNGEPIYFWTFSRAVWREAGDMRTSFITLPLMVALIYAFIMELFCKLLARDPPELTRQKVRVSTMTRYYNIDKAKTRLNYKPSVSLNEGLKRSVKSVLQDVIEKEQLAKEGKKRQ